MSDIGQPDTTNVRYDSEDEAGGDDRHTIAGYIGDMLALERHIGTPLERQTHDDDAAKYGDAAAIVAQIRSLERSHEQALKERLDGLGGDGTAGLKSAWTGLLGAGAAAVHGARRTKISRSLRDDYTALALASISYTMLHTTALGLGDEATAALAKRHLDDYAPLVVTIGKAMPAIVLQELRDAGEDVRVDAAGRAERNATDSWRN